MRFFKKIKPYTVREAKNRLKSVIINDRMNVSENMTLEKIRKEVSAVLGKYAPKNDYPPEVTVTCQNGAVCLISASVLIKKGDNIR